MFSHSGFLHDDVLLDTSTAQALFHDVAEQLPIVDVHNHLDASDIANDRRWPTITDFWLGDDHYKWKAMRLAGFAEELVSGNADPWERFEAWAATVPLTLRNPLYLWTHLELKRVFGVDIVLSPATAKEIWQECNHQLATRWSAKSLLNHFRVNAVATTDDPTSLLLDHHQHSTNGDRTHDTGTRMSNNGPALLPTFRPDAAHRLLQDPTSWNEWITRLGAATNEKITGLDSLLRALAISYAHMASLGARASDHGLSSIPDCDRDPAAADMAVRSALNGCAATDAQRELVLLEVIALAARLAHQDDSVLQLHLGPLRNVSPRVLATVGRDAGSDVMGDDRQAPGLARFLGTLEAEATLPRTVLYNLNPADNLMFATMANAFARPGVRSLVQWGPPWWFNDTEQGMRKGLDDLSQVGLLGNFIGMLTDSRSILSMTRHELFRRLLCDILGRDVESGRIPNDRVWLDEVVHNLCVGNAVEFFGFPQEWTMWRGGAA
jgi:glucuronate isomerase